jgi:hypothetical protein
LLSATKITGGYLLTLSLKNVGSNILKSLVVTLHSAQKGFSDCAEGFIYALMPSAKDTVKLKVFASSLSRLYFSVAGYASGDTYFSTQSPIIRVKTKGTKNNLLLLLNELLGEDIEVEYRRTERKKVQLIA